MTSYYLDDACIINPYTKDSSKYVVTGDQVNQHFYTDTECKIPKDVNPVVPVKHGESIANRDKSTYFGLNKAANDVKDSKDEDKCLPMWVIVIIVFMAILLSGGIHGVVTTKEAAKEPLTKKQET